MLKLTVRQMSKAFQEQLFFLFKVYLKTKKLKILEKMFFER